MDRNLEGKKVAILAANGFELAELMEPKQALEQAGARTKIVSISTSNLKGWEHDHWADTIPVDESVQSATVKEYDALLIPGGVMSPDKLRMNTQAVQFVKSFFDAGKPVASICHGPWMLVEADALRGRTVTSWPSLKTDIRNAGGKWVDEEVVADNGLVTSRKPDDIPAFNRKMIEEFAEGIHHRLELKAA